MKLLKRIKNLWGLSNFEITEFDNKLVITKKNDELVFARPQQAQIIKRTNDTDEFLQS